MPKRRNATTVRTVSETARLRRERNEALEQQAATSEVLRVISTSPGELDSVFQTILEKATRLCTAKFGFLWQVEDGNAKIVSKRGIPLALAKYLQRGPHRPPLNRPSPLTAIIRVVQSHQTIHITDYRIDQSYLDRDPGTVAAVELGGARTLLIVPMLKDNELIGAIGIYRQEVRPFTEKQITLVTNFAAQAVIAIENARLLNELRQRTDDLSEALEQQTATSEVLRVISSSPGELEPVFQAMLENATRICEAKFGVLFRFDGNMFNFAADVGTSPEFAAFLRERGPLRPGPETALARLAKAKQIVPIEDLTSARAYVERDPLAVAAVELGGVRTYLGVPMLKENELVGAIAIYRQDIRPFTDKQIALVQNFAAQAVIAIENARLLNELRQSLQQQTATADVLKVISRSTFDLQTIFDTLVESAARLCEADRAQIMRPREHGFYSAACYGHTSEYSEYIKTFTFPPGRGSVTGRVLLEGKPIQIADVLADAEYAYSGPQKLGGYRTHLGVPLLREGNPIGVIILSRQTVKPFDVKQIELAQTFADQAVIAIENVRLFDEVQARTEELSESLQQQTATAEVLKLITRSTFNLQTVLDTLIESAASLCEADLGYIGRPKGDDFFRAEAGYGLSPAHKDLVDRTPWKAGRESAIGRVLLERAPIHIVDVATDPEYRMVEIQQAGGYHSVFGVPLQREGTLIGVLILARREVRPFTDKQIELVQTFADQAVIAIDNVRLFDEIQDKSRQLEEASQHKSQFLANMSHELRTPLNAILGYAELMADGAYGEPSEKMLGILKRLEANGKHLLGLINDVLDLSKIEAGQLVLELSDYCIQDIAQTVRSTLEPLAADKKLGFKVEVAPQLPSGHGDGRRLTQVLINLVGNAIKFTDAGEVAIKAHAQNGSFHVSVRDTGPGISSADQARLFQEFQQADNAITKKKGGTGLGLAISKRIIEMHGGRIWVESQPGQGSTFTFALPVIVERQIESP
jgi:GAF domain-containing protein